MRVKMSFAKRWHFVPASMCWHGISTVRSASDILISKTSSGCLSTANSIPTANIYKKETGNSTSAISIYIRYDKNGGTRQTIMIWLILNTILTNDSAHRDDVSIWHTITITSSRARRRLKSSATRLFTQPFIQAQIQENIKAPRHWPLCGELIGGPWIPRTNGQ